MNNQIIATKRFQECFEKCWAGIGINQQQFDNVMLWLWWDLTKNKIKKMTIWSDVDMNDESRNELKFLKNSYNQRRISLNENIEAKINRIYATNTEGARVRSRVNWYEKGQSSTAYFENFEKKREKEKLWDGALDCDETYGTEKMIALSHSFQM